jgi:hypothetical protein
VIGKRDIALFVTPKTLKNGIEGYKSKEKKRLYMTRGYFPNKRRKLTHLRRIIGRHVR